jgi:hypothetical protein
MLATAVRIPTEDDYASALDVLCKAQEAVEELVLSLDALSGAHDAGGTDSVVPTWESVGQLWSFRDGVASYAQELAEFVTRLDHGLSTVDMIRGNVSLAQGQR